MNPDVRLCQELKYTYAWALLYILSFLKSQKSETKLSEERGGAGGGTLVSSSLLELPLRISHSCGDSTYL